MNSALLFALAVAFTFAIVGTLIAGRGSLRRGFRRLLKGLKEALSELLIYVVLGGAALLIAVLAGGDAWTFVAIAVAAVCLIVLVILVARRRTRQ
jgi:hypothetical protein